MQTITSTSNTHVNQKKKKKKNRQRPRQMRAPQTYKCKRSQVQCKQQQQKKNHTYRFPVSALTKRVFYKRGQLLLVLCERASLELVCGARPAAVCDHLWQHIEWVSA